MNTYDSDDTTNTTLDESYICNIHIRLNEQRPTQSTLCDNRGHKTGRTFETENRKHGNFHPDPHKTLRSFELSLKHL